MPALKLVLDGAGRGRLYAHGILVAGLRAAIAEPGGAVMLLIDQDAVAIERPSMMPPLAQDNAARPLLATDGQA